MKIITVSSNRFRQPWCGTLIKFSYTVIAYILLLLLLASTLLHFVISETLPTRNFSNFSNVHIFPRLNIFICIFIKLVLLLLLLHREGCKKFWSRKLLTSFSSSSSSSFLDFIPHKLYRQGIFKHFYMYTLVIFIEMPIISSWNLEFFSRTFAFLSFKQF